jgi:hypothetical protein
MLSIYIPFVSTGTNANPTACVGDSLYEWVVNNSTNTLTGIRKDTYSLISTIDLPAAGAKTSSPYSGCSNITIGTYLNNNYVFTSSGSSTGNIYRYYPGSDLFPIAIKDSVTNVSCNAIVYKNGYLWLVPSFSSSITGTIIRLNIFNDRFKADYNYNSLTGSFDTQVTVYNGITTITNEYTVSTMYIFGNYVFTLSNKTDSPTVITKMSTLTTGTGIISNPTTYSYTYSNTTITSIASDNINYIWISDYSTGNIYRKSIESNISVTVATPSSDQNVSKTYASSLINVYTIKYGAGYLWIAGTTGTTNIPALVQFDVVNETIITTIPLITISSYGGKGSSIITSIDIYNEYMWLTDSVNSALLKMKIYIPCFMEGTKILCLNAQMKEEYIPIENIRKGHLVKTSLNGFVPVCMIGHSIISNPGVNDRIKNRLYKCTKDNYPELFEDLYITGCHSILVDKLSDSQLKTTKDELGDVFITDRKYRLMAYLDDRSEPYTETGTYNIWHLALENNDYLMNYGIYANGLLVESTSKRYMKELSGMKLVE